MTWRSLAIISDLPGSLLLFCTVYTAKFPIYEDAQ
jgi:hypothetical protein